MVFFVLLLYGRLHKSYYYCRLVNIVVVLENLKKPAHMNISMLAYNSPTLSFSSLLRVPIQAC